MGLENAVRIRDKMHVVYKKMTRDRAKSNVAKWNLIGGIQFKHVRNRLMFMQCNDWVCSDWVFLDFGRCFQGTCWNISCLASAL